MKLTNLLTAAALAAALTGPVVAQTPDEALAALATQTLSTGPGGETPAAASSVSLTDEELAQIRDMNATAAIVMHYGGNDWSQAQINGLQDQFGKMGIEVIAVTDAGFQAAKQVSDIETILAQNPSIIVSIPTDPVATAQAYKQAADKGVKLVFMDNVPAGFNAGRPSALGRQLRVTGRRHRWPKTQLQGQIVSSSTLPTPSSEQRHDASRRPSPRGIPISRSLRSRASADLTSPVTPRRPHPP